VLDTEKSRCKIADMRFDWMFDMDMKEIRSLAKRMKKMKEDQWKRDIESYVRTLNVIKIVSREENRAKLADILKNIRDRNPNVKDWPV
jgi:hypothetical protein